MNATDRINYLNIGLMAAAAVAAFVLPFEAFLFAYAVLGPLHYLTEISWLHEKRYFTKHRYDYLLLGIVAVALLVLAFGIDGIFQHAPQLFPGYANADAVKQSAMVWANALIYVAFASALVMITLKRSLYRAFAFLFILVTAQFIKDKNSAFLFFSIFLPTLIHVFFFTGAFVLYGALKTRSRSGLISFAAFLIFPALLWLFNGLLLGRPVSDYVLHSYDGFLSMNVSTIQLLHLGNVQSANDVFYSSYGVLVMRFIAYAYTYHYLNWFSKTSIIRWHEVSKPRIAAIVSLWLVSVGLYAINYKTGVIALYCLSFMHVFLEFPLNHVTFLGIGREIVKRRRNAAASQAAVPAPVLISEGK